MACVAFNIVIAVTAIDDVIAAHAVEVVSIVAACECVCINGANVFSEDVVLFVTKQFVDVCNNSASLVLKMQSLSAALVT